MRRHINWGFILFGTLIAIAGLTSAVWIPLVQPEVTEDIQEAFECPEYLSGEQCSALRQIYEEDPVLAETLRETLGENTVAEQQDEGLSFYVSLLREGSSDPPDTVPGRSGEFVRIDPIRTASGTAQLWEIVSFDGTQFYRILRFEGVLEDEFFVTNGVEQAVYLAVEPAPLTTDQLFGPNGDNAVEIDILRGNVGARNYEIPPDVDITRYASVVIYDRQLGIVFSYAALQ